MKKNRKIAGIKQRYWQAAMLLHGGLLVCLVVAVFLPLASYAGAETVQLGADTTAEVTFRQGDSARTTSTDTIDVILGDGDYATDDFTLKTSLGKEISWYHELVEVDKENGKLLIRLEKGGMGSSALSTSLFCKLHYKDKKIGDIVLKLNQEKLYEDASLSELSYQIGNGSAISIPGFTPGTKEYNIELPADTSETASISLQGAVNDIYANIITNEGVILEAGEGTAAITVSAEKTTITATYTVNFTRDVIEPDSDEEYLASASNALAAASYEIDQDTAEDEDSFELELVSKINQLLDRLFNSEAEAIGVDDIEELAITMDPVAGDETDQVGCDGEFTFDVTIHKGGKSITVEGITGTIKATPYVAEEEPNEDAGIVDAALDIIEDADFRIPQRNARTSAALEKELRAQLKKLVKDVTISGLQFADDIEFAVAGTRENKGGIAGNFSFRVSISYGSVNNVWSRELDGMIIPQSYSSGSSGSGGSAGGSSPGRSTVTSQSGPGMLNIMPVRQLPETVQTVKNAVFVQLSELDGLYISVNQALSFPLPLQLKMPEGTETGIYPGSTVRLYWYNPQTGQLEMTAENQYVISSEGDVTITIGQGGVWVLLPLKTMDTAVLTNTIVHTVKAGDTVYHLAQQYGCSIADIIAVNQIADVYDLRIGSELVIPVS